jgi:hypothetical protein
MVLQRKVKGNRVIRFIKLTQFRFRSGLRPLLNLSPTFSLTLNYETRRRSQLLETLRKAWPEQDDSPESRLGRK